MIVVIGGSGFVGTRLCERLHAAGVEFRIADKVRSNTFPGKWMHVDVRDISGLRTVIPPNSTIVNLAAEHRDDVRPVSLYDEVNVQGAANICQVAVEKKVERIVFTSSVACYGFAPAGTDESGSIAPFNEYGRTKFLAEEVFRKWFASDPSGRSLVILRPTVIFGEQNRGNIYNLIRFIASGKFVMIGDGSNVKSIAYVENVASALEYSLSFDAGSHLYNYVDHPDFDMKSFVSLVRVVLNKGSGVGIRLPYFAGLLAGFAFDLVARISGKTFPVSAIRVKKFCAVTKFASSFHQTGFSPPVPLGLAIERTVRHEFLEDHSLEATFFSE